MLLKKWANNNHIMINLHSPPLANKESRLVFLLSFWADIRSFSKDSVASSREMAISSGLPGDGWKQVIELHTELTSRHILKRNSCWPSYCRFSVMVDWKVSSNFPGRFCSINNRNVFKWCFVRPCEWQKLRTWAAFFSRVLTLSWICLHGKGLCDLAATGTRCGEMKIPSDCAAATIWCTMNN